MDLIVLTLIFQIFILIAALWVSQGDMTAPAVIFTASFTVLLLVANMMNWYFKFNLKEETVVLVVSANILFVLIEYVIDFLKTLNRRRAYRQNDKTASALRTDISNAHKPIILSNKMQKLMVAYMVFALVICIAVIFFNTSGSSWIARMGQYKTVLAADTIRGKSSMRFLFVRDQISRLAKTAAYVIAYIIVFNRVLCKIPLKNQKRYILMLLLFFPISLSQGGRQSTVELVIFIILIYLFLLKSNRQKVKFFSLVSKIAVLLVAFVFLFTVLAAVVGRTNIKRDPIIYVSTYVCGGFKNFDALIVGHPFSTKLFGQSTFSCLYSFFIKKFHVLSPSADLSLHSFGLFGSNTVTIFGRWYEDFGVGGVFLMTALVALFYSWLHNKAKAKQAPNLLHIIYIQQLTSLVWAGYDDRITYLMTVGNILNLLLITIVYRVLVGGGKHRFVFKKRNGNIHELQG